MKMKILILCLLAFSQLAQASDQQFIASLGVSSKGQFVALEEYGYKSDLKSYYVQIKIVNVWTKEYVTQGVSLQTLAVRPSELVKLREKAKLLAQTDLVKFKINQ
jgi:predicted secreted protein